MRSTFLMWPVARSGPVVQGRRTSAPAEGFMSAALAVLRTASALEPDPLEAMAWYRSVPIAVLDGLTAATLVRQGRAYAVLAFLQAAIESDRTERQTPR